MKRFALPLLLAISSVCAFAQGGNTLTIGDPAPAFKVDGHIKGDKITELKKGEMYVIEFWATWCGPCIAVFPHLSELTEKYEGKITTVSVNTWDYRGDADKNAHINKINKFLETHGKNMRYNIVLDDANDTIAKTWMTPAGRNGIPCAFIINEEGRIAWIGHPASMDKPLEAIVNKTWDLEAFKQTFEQEAVKAREAQQKAAEAQAKMAKIAKDKDWAAYEAMAKENGAYQTLIQALNTDTNFATLVLEKYSANIKEVTPEVFCNMSAFLSGRPTTTAESKAKLVKMSEACFKELEETKAAAAAVYHAQVLMNSGDKDGAKNWLAKAETLVEKFDPENGRARIKSMIASAKKQLEGAN